MIQFNTGVLKTAKNRRKIYTKSNYSLNTFIYFSNIRCLCFQFLYFKQLQVLILLRKIALPYPHKCLLGFVEAKRGDQQEY